MWWQESIFCVLSQIWSYSVSSIAVTATTVISPLDHPWQDLAPGIYFFFLNCFVAYPFHVETAKITTDLREGLVRLTLPRFNFYCKDKIIVRCGLTDFCSIVTSLSPSFFCFFFSSKLWFCWRRPVFAAFSHHFSNCSKSARQNHNTVYAGIARQYGGISYREKK